jgi:excinuclease ABC subunit A
MRPDQIVIQGAREHNLKNVTVTIPRDRLVVLTGVSGSGKSSLAFDTLYAEGQRRYVESLSSYARQFLGNQQKPAVDYIVGLSPAISIEQKSASRNPRSTVGTVTEIHDYLRVLYARIGVPHCPSCGRKVGAQTAEQIVDQVLAQAPGSQWLILAPIARNRKGEFQDVFTQARKDGFVRVRVNGQVFGVDSPPSLDKKRKHVIDIVIDRVRVPEPGPDGTVAEDAIDRQRLTDSVETALRVGEGTMVLAPMGDLARTDAPPPNGAIGDATSSGGLKGMQAAAGDLLFAETSACAYCNLSFEELSPQLFSFNSPVGACPDCLGLGSTIAIDETLVVPDPSKTILEGAVVPWGEQDDEGGTGWGDRYRAQVLAAYGVPVDVAWRDLTPGHRHLLMQGADGDKIKITWTNKDGSGGSWFSKWEGIVPRIQRILKQTTSESQRQHYMQYFSQQPCAACHGEKLKPEARAVTVGDTRLPDLEHLSIGATLEFFAGLNLPPREATIAHDLLNEIRGRLEFLVNVGLHYLTLDRAAPTLSGGESQRIRLASQIGCGLVGVLYILDEPSIGLHQRDNGKLIQTLETLRDTGNTVIVVEHDLDTMFAADWLIDFGPGAGVNGGEVVAFGTPRQVARNPRSLTGQFLSGAMKIEVPATRRAPGDQWLTIRGAREHNLKDVDVAFPLECFVAVAGVSGSGKSSLVNGILRKALEQRLMRAQARPGAHAGLEGVEHLDKVIAIDQDPIGRTPRSNPATYVGVYDQIRELFSNMPEAKIRGYKPGRFSFNVKGGRCEACAGDGVKRIEMQFLADVFVPCEVCTGKRFNRETLEVKFRGKSIADVLDMSVEEAVGVFENVPGIARVLRTLLDVGLGYMRLGQASTTLSGGEAQRVKLARELCRPATGRTLYILDEPTTGLHFADVQKLLDVLQRLTNAGNTVIVIEHNLDVLKCADWIIDLGPEGGSGGGQVLATGTPESVARIPGAPTGAFLAEAIWPTPRAAITGDGVSSDEDATAGDGADAGHNDDGASDAPTSGLSITPAGLREWRLRMGLSQAEAARIAGVSRGLLAEAERGKRAGERTLARLALALRDHEARIGALLPAGPAVADVAAVSR